MEIEDNTIQVDMVKQLEDCTEMFDEDVSKLVLYLATKKLFKVREHAKQMSEKKV